MADEDTQQDMFNQSDEEEKAPETVDEQEMLWRKQRLEREKFLEEQTVSSLGLFTFNHNYVSVVSGSKIINCFSFLGCCGH